MTEHLRRLQSQLAGRTNESREALLNDLVPNLVKALAPEVGRPSVDLRGQAYEGNIGRPDFSVKDHLLLIGHVETKAPGLGADTRRFRGHDKEQWERFRKLPNVLYTDGISFGLYRSGERVGPILTLTFDVADPVIQLTPTEVGKLTALLGDFLSYKAVPPTTLTALAENLAPLCALLRDTVLEKLVDPTSEVSKAAAEVREVLFADRSDAEVADAVAQVCSYSMLLARANGATKLDAPTIERTLHAGHPVLGRVVTVLLDDQTEEELGWALDTLRALIEAVDFARLRKTALPGMVHFQRTWLYFYEDFLAAYDPKLRDAYGVYYTPQPVIQAQITLLDEILRKRLSRSEGLASPGVTLLDPAVGTGSYALELIETVAETVTASRGLGAVPNVLTSLASNFFAFEILVGPYSVAHLRLSEILQDFGAATPTDGLHVYLTDTLANPFAEPLTLTRQLEPLVEEQKRATEVKGKREILVCLGNPPYERLSAIDESGAEKGGWVVHGEGAGVRPIFADFVDPARANTAVGHLRSLYNSYVFFWRWALWKVFEAPNTDGMSNDRPGVVTFITASSYLTGPGFLGMREHMRRLCDEIWIIDLGGDNRGARKEENVFAIETPVAICIAVRAGAASNDKPGRVRYTRIRGNRKEKLDQLLAIRALDDLAWKDASGGWHATFTPTSEADWKRHPALTDLFPMQIPGPVVARTWPVAVTADTVRDRWTALKAAPREEKGAYFDDKRFGRSSTTRPAGGFPAPASLEPIVDLTSESKDPQAVPYGYRSFDRRWIVSDNRVMRTPSQGLWAHYSDDQIYLVSMLTYVIGAGPAASVSALIPDYHFFANRGGKDVVPFLRDAMGTPNVTQGLLDALAGSLGDVHPEALFAYATAILSHPGYTERFWDALETPGPRVPITADRALFNEVVDVGRRVNAVQTFGTRGEGGLAQGAARIEKPIGTSMPTEFSYDPTTKTLTVGEGAVANVDPAVWQFSISGFEVVRSWLRGRLLHPTGRASSSKSPLDAIRPTHWTAGLDNEFLEMLWAIEATLALYEKQAALLERVMEGKLLDASGLPTPTEAERVPAPLSGEQGQLFEEADEAQDDEGA